MSDPKNSKNIIFSPRIMGTSRSSWFNPFEHQSTQITFQIKMTKMPLVNTGLTKSQNLSKPHTKTIFFFFIFLHQTWGYLRFLSILTKFDLRLTLNSNRKPNFDPTVRMGWSQCHCKEYWISFLMTTHGSKLEL